MERHAAWLVVLIVVLLTWIVLICCGATAKKKAARNSRSERPVRAEATESTNDIETGQINGGENAVSAAAVGGGSERGHAMGDAEATKDNDVQVELPSKGDAACPSKEVDVACPATEGDESRARDRQQ